MEESIFSYERIIKRPGSDIINWEFITMHPEAKFAIRERYQADIIFRARINEKRKLYPWFNQKFEHFFPGLGNSKSR